MDDASPWIRRWLHLLPEGAAVLDLACGGGRHTRLLAARGHAVTAVDQDADAIAALQGVAAEARVADLEGAPWPYAGRQWQGIVVTNYLHRPLLPVIEASLAPGGVLLYETFAIGQETVGRPRNPEFLLQPGELLDAVRGTLRVVGYEDGYLDTRDAFVQRLAAVREAGRDPAAPPRYILD